jgi:hypothetical protein
LNQIEKCLHEKGYSIRKPEDVTKLVASLDVDDNYIVSRTKSADPFKLLHQKHLLSTQLLHPKMHTEFYNEIKTYKEANSDREELIELAVRPYFVMNQSPAIPLTVIEKKYGVESISRIFSTLNRTGKLLTPFELVVAVLFPHDIDLNDDLEELREEYPIYANMDSTGELMLQTIALYNNASPKKSLLPQTIDKVSYKSLHKKACQAMDNLGKHLSDRLGLALNVTGELVPYDAIFPPMAIVYELVVEKLTGKALQQALRKLERWFVGAALAGHYQRSTHDRQVKDRAQMQEWALCEGDELEPQWLKETTVPPLIRVEPSSARGKLCRCLMNKNEIRDPLTGKNVGLKPEVPPTHLHHIFPKKFVCHIAEWTARDTADLVLNTMYVEQGTNVSWLREDPRLQVNQSRGARGVVEMKKIYAAHGLTESAIAIMERPEKTKGDFEEFLLERQGRFFEVLVEYGFKPTTSSVDDDPGA